jgi:predicted glutamine amidotransferase
MARLFGLIGNRADLAGRVLGFEADALRVRSRGQQLGWGVGFYQSGEVLMRRRPIDDREEIDMAKFTSDVRADVVLGHVRSATVGAVRTENTHPFRYRQWLFAQTGTIAHFESIRDRVVQSVPEFLRGGIRGDTDSEILFHVFLSFLHDAGRLNDAVIEPGIVREALRSSLAVVDGMTAEVGGEPGSLNVLVTNGEYMVAAHRAAGGAAGTTARERMAWRIFAGKNDADMILGDDLQLRRKTPELAQMHFVLLASDFDEEPNARWKPAPDRAIVTITRGSDPQVEAL